MKIVLFIKKILRLYERQILYIINKVPGFNSVYLNLSMAPNDFDLKIIEKHYDNANNIQFSIITPVLKQENWQLSWLRAVE